MQITQLPNFFVIGAPKAGTSALYFCLKQHPDIYMSPIKEPHYFTFDGEAPIFSGPKGAHFRRVGVSRPRDYLCLFAGVKAQSAIGEASTTYLKSPIAAKRISKFAPGAKIIALLRQPADRAYSHYQYLRSQEVEPSSSFVEALSRESVRQGNNWFSGHLYKAGGFYYSQLRTYFDHFPREQIKIYLYEDWNTCPTNVLRDLFGFLEVYEDFTPETRRNNVTRIPQNHRIHRLATDPERIERLLSGVLLPGSVRKMMISCLQGLNSKYNLTFPPPIDPQIRQQLTESYREDILKTQELIGRDLSHWLKPK
jgi:sulfotransferase family protein